MLFQTLFSSQANTLPITVNTVASVPVALPSSGGSLRVVNEGANTVFIAVSTLTVSSTATLPNATPTTTSTPILPGSDVILSVPVSNFVYQISAITRAGASTIYVSVGEGM